LRIIVLDFFLIFYPFQFKFQYTTHNQDLSFSILSKEISNN